MRSQEVPLSVLFNVIDSNSDKKLNKSEFKQKMRALHLDLQEEELEALFNDIDIDNDKYIIYDEFIQRFSAINTQQILSRMKKILSNSNTSIEACYKSYTKTSSMRINEFKELMTYCFGKGKMSTSEVELIFDNLVKQFDRNAASIPREQRGLPKDRFLEFFGRGSDIVKAEIGIDDIFKPLREMLIRRTKEKPVGSGLS